MSDDIRDHPHAVGDELRDEYQFDYSQAKPNRFAAAVKAGELALPKPTAPAAGRGVRARSTSTDVSLRKLRDAATAFTRDRESAEAKVAHINPTIERLRRAGLLAADHTIIGPVVHAIGFGESETVQYFAAGIRGDGGIGTFRYHLGFGEEPDEFTTYEFVPFAECLPIVQAELFAQLDELLAQLMTELGVQAS